MERRLGPFLMVYGALLREKRPRRKPAVLARLFLRHPRSVGESYVRHAVTAIGLASELLAAALACAVHALIPGLLERTASGIVARLNTKMAMRSIHGRAALPRERQEGLVPLNAAEV